MGKDRKRVMVLGAFQAHPMDFESINDSIDLHFGPKQADDDYEAALLVIDERDSPARTAEQLGDKPFIVIADESRMVEMVELGCSGFLGWDTTAKELLETIEIVLEGGAAIPPEMLGTLLRHIVRRQREMSRKPAGWEDLTDRERQVFELAASGSDRNEIAAELFISPETVRTHLQRVYQKLGVHSQTELMSLRQLDLALEEVDE